MTSARRDVTAALLLLAAMTSSVTSSERGCAGAALCCPGRNQSCSSTGRSAGSKDATDTCFCDEECLAIGDCCLDYRAACPRTWRPSL